MRRLTTKIANVLLQRDETVLRPGLADLGHPPVEQAVHIAT
jgi:hypothetical protein